MIRIFLGLLAFLFSCTSCATKRVAIYCEPQRAAIYIDGQHRGNGVANCRIPVRQKYVTVSCSEDGVSFVNQRYYVRSMPARLNIYLDEYKVYSSDPQTLTTNH